MDFSFSSEQQQLGDTVRRLIEREYDFQKHRRAIIESPEGVSRGVWKSMADVGLCGIGIPEELGGFGGNAIDTMVVMEALGRGLVVEPYLATVVLGAQLIAQAGNAAQRADWLPKIIDGTLFVAVAHSERGARYDLNQVTTRAKADGDAFVLNGSKSVVLHGNVADKLIVSARTSGAERDAAGISLFLVDANAAGVSHQRYRTLDNHRAADVTLKGVRVPASALLGTRDQALQLIEALWDYGASALCGEAVGAMAAMQEATLEYLKTRRQFGVPIGKFQSLQHRMVDMLTNLEQARSMAYLAAVKVQSPDANERARVVAAAKNAIGRYSRFCAQQAVQMHGGMGIVDELNISHYFRRLTAIDATLGDADHQLARFASHPHFV
jgi:alkylation response protein AidB-like acyl-CoA dehydrogenase